MQTAKESKTTGRVSTKRRARGFGWLLVGVVAGCVGYAVQPIDITTTGATLRAKTSCTADTTTNACTGWFQFWRAGTSTIQETPHVQANVNTNGLIDFSQSVSGLSADTLYHYQFCGFGDSNISPPGVCTGPLTGASFYGANAPGALPDPGDLNTVQSFVTAGTNTQGTVSLGRVLSTADTNDMPISRDAGVSVQISSNPARSLWLFGDTQQNHVGFIARGSAAIGSVTPGQAPTGIDELPTPPQAPASGLTAPSPFFPAPASLRRTNGTTCNQSGSYSAAWVMGGAKEPNASRALLVYGEICVETNPLAFTMERVALAEYDPTNNSFVRIDRPFQASPLGAGLPVQKGLGSPVFGGDGYLYFYSSAANTVYVARVGATAAQWSNAANFSWWTGSAWDSNSANAANILPGATPIGSGVSVADYSAVSSKKFVLIEQVAFGSGAFQVFQSTSPRGPWTLVGAGRPPDLCTGGGFGCYAIAGHPELSTSTQLVFSWYSPDDRDGYGHIRLGAMAW